MATNRISPLLIAGVFLLAFASPTLANSIAPSAFFLPGILPMTMGLALPASVLAAVLERPFVSRAGVGRYALWYSLQANFLSLLIGYVTMPFAYAIIYVIGPLWCIIAISISILSEGWYYSGVGIKTPGKLRWGWIVGGNVFSQRLVAVHSANCCRDQGSQSTVRVELGPISRPPVLGKCWWKHCRFRCQFFRSESAEQNKGSQTDFKRRHHQCGRKIASTSSSKMSNTTSTSRNSKRKAPAWSAST
jgi:hypothetical protein